MLTRRAFQTGALLVVAGGTTSMADIAALTGTWSGVFEVGSHPLRLKFNISDDGSAKLFSLDQGGQPIAGQVKSAGAVTEAEFPAIGGRFTVRSQDRNRIEGVWRQGTLELPLVLERGEASPSPPSVSALTNERLTALRTQAGSPAMIAAAARDNAPLRIWVSGERAVGTRMRPGRATSGISVRSASR